MRNRITIAALWSLLIAPAIIGSWLILPRQTASDVAPLVALARIGSTALPAPPPLPSSFYGTAMLNGVDVPVGALVTAWINGTRYAQASVTTFEGRSFYAINVPADDPTSPAIEGGREEDSIEFHIDEVKAGRTATWRGGNNIRMDLVAVRP
jgi:hypothetical protein